MRTQSKWEKQVDLCKKLYEISMRGGSTGEIKQAKLHLERKMKKFNITMEDILGNEDMPYKIPYVSPVHKRFILNVTASVIGKKVEKGYCEEKQKVMVLKVTQREREKIEKKLDFYWKDFNGMLEIFFHAYTQVNKLRLPLEEVPEDEPQEEQPAAPPPPTEEKEPKVFSEDDNERPPQIDMRRLYKMMASLDETYYAEGTLYLKD